MKFRKRPVVIDAEQLTEERAMSFLRNKTPLPPGAEFARASYHDKDNRLDYFHCVIRTLEGTMRAEIGDWIIRGVKGEYYPCKPDIFAATYAPAPEGEQGR